MGSAFAVVYAITFALLSLASELFYRPLHVEPAEVGLNYANLLAQSAVSLLVFVGVHAFVLAMLALAAGAGEAADESRGTRAVYGWGFVIGTAVWVFAMLVIRLAWDDSAALAATGAGLVLTWVAGAYYIALQTGLGAFRLRRHVLRYLPAITAALIGGFFGIAHLDGVAARGGHTSDSILGVPFPWHAEGASIRWTGSPPQPVALRGCLLYLGQADGTAVLYNPAGRGTTVRAPSADLVVDVLDHGCG
jgi:hypothetical protein